MIVSTIQKFKVLILEKTMEILYKNPSATEIASYAAKLITFCSMFKYVVTYKSDDFLNMESDDQNY